MTRPYVLSETTWKTVDATPYGVAILPWGATEAHNYHLPYATDNIQAEQIAIREVGIEFVFDQDGNPAGILVRGARLDLSTIEVR